MGHKETKKSKQVEDCHALKAGTNAAIEEINAEERNIRKI
jgi:hypothetical protein